MFFLCKHCGALCILPLKGVKTCQNRAKNSQITRRSTVFEVFRRYFYALPLRYASLSCLSIRVMLAVVKDSVGLVMEPENKAALERVEQVIIDLQNAVLELHKAKQQRSVTAADYVAQIKEYSQQMQELEAQQTELQTTENRYAEVKLWLDSFAEHIQSGNIMNTDDSMIMKQLVEQIIVTDDGIEVHFKSGIVASHEYL